MFEQPLATVTAAVIALVGTLAGIVAASRRFSRERRDARGNRFRAEQHDVYKTLWDRVEQLTVALRRDRVEAGAFPALVADLNEFILRNGVHLDESDHLLVNRYIKAAQAVHAAMTNAGADVRESYSKTDAIPMEIVRAADELGAAQAEARKLREELRLKVRSILAETV